MPELQRVQCKREREREREERKKKRMMQRKGSNVRQEKKWYHELRIEN